MPITLNSFREFADIKGNANVQLDAGKAKLSPLAGKVRQVEGGDRKNREVRQAFYDAIVRSREGAVLSDGTMSRIKDILGLSQGAKAAEGNALLSRRDIRTVLKLVDAEATTDELVAKLCDDLKARLGDNRLHKESVRIASGMCGMKNLAVRLASPEAMAKRLPKGFRNLTKDQLNAFVRNNFAVLKMRIFENFYWEAAQNKSTNHMDVDYNVDELIAGAVSGLLLDYADGRDSTGPSRSVLPTAEPRAALGAEDEAAYLNCGLKALEESLERIASVKTGRVLGDCRLKNLCLHVAKTLRDDFAQWKSAGSAEAVKTAVRQKYGALKARLDSFLAAIDLFRDNAACQKSMAAALSRLVSLAAPSAGGGTDVCATLAKALGSWCASYSAERGVERVCDALKMTGEEKAACCAELRPKLVGQKAYRDFLKSAFSLADEDVARFGSADPSPLKDFDAAVKEAVEDWRNERAEAAQQRLRNKTALSEEIDRCAEKFKSAVADDHQITDMVATFKRENAQATEEQIAQFKTEAEAKFKVANGYLSMGFYVFGHAKLQEAGIVESNGVISADKRLETLEAKVGELKSMLVERGLANALPLDDLNKLHDCGLLERLDEHPALRDVLVDGVVDVKKLDASAARLYGGLISPKRTTSMYDFVRSDDVVQLVDYVCDKYVTKYPLLLGAVPDAKMFYPTLADKTQYEAMGGGVGFMQGYLSQPDVPSLNKDQLAGFLRELALGNCDLSKMGATPQGKLSLLALLHFVKKNGGPSGLAEYCRRELGKPMDKVDFEDMLKDLQKSETKKFERDLKDVLLEKDDLANVFAGKKVLSQYAWTQKDLLAFHQTLMQLEGREASGDEAPGTTVNLASKDYTFVRLPNGEATVSTTVKTGVFSTGDCQFRLAKPIVEMRKLVETALAREAKSLAKLTAEQIGKNELAKCLLKIVESSSRESSVRQREICNCILDGLGKGNAVAHAGVSLQTLRTAVVNLLNGRPEDNLQGVGTDCLNTAEAVEMHRDMVQANQDRPGSVDKVVRMASTEAKTDILERQKNPDLGEIRNFAADLLSTLDTWDEDAAQQSGGPAPQRGERIRRVILRYAPEILHLKKNAALMERLSLPDLIGGRVRGVIAKLLEQVAERGDRPGELDLTNLKADEIEGEVSKMVGGVAQELQRAIAGSFKAKTASTVPVWQRSFGELAGGEGLDLGTRQGKFADKILKAYFTESAEVDKRRMISALIRKTEAGDSNGKVVAELLKGAGPLMQKLLQGLPLESFDRDMQEALADMKARLPPIADEAVKAQLFALVRSSNGAINSITVHKSLGAASVGQAFLCTVYTPDHPNLGVPCVIKLLRPTAATAISRDKQVFDKILSEQERKDFEGQYAGILRELDFTVEAQNVDVGTRVYEKPKLEHPNGITMIPLKTLPYVPGLKADNIHSMARLDVVSPTTNALIGSLAPGETVDGCLRRLNGEIDALLTREDEYGEGEGRPHAVIVKRSALEKGGPVVESFEATSELAAVAMRRKLFHVRKTMINRYRAVDKLLHVWFHQAVFGSGKFFHGDLHAGNVMADDENLTVIDYGNCMALSEQDEKTLQGVVMAATAGRAENFLSALGIGNANDQLKGDLEAILKKGLYTDVLSRVQGALTLLQQNGYATPPVLTNFFQSYTRLANILTSIGHDIDRIETMGKDLAVIRPAPQDEVLRGDIERVGAFKTFDGVLSAILGVDGKSYPTAKDIEAKFPWDQKRNKAELLAQIRALGKDKTLAVLEDFRRRLTLPDALREFDAIALASPKLYIDKLIEATKQLFDALEKEPNADVSKLEEAVSLQVFCVYTSIAGSVDNLDLSPSPWSRATGPNYHGGVVDPGKKPGLRSVSVIVGEVIKDNAQILVSKGKVNAASMFTDLCEEIIAGDKRLDNESAYVDAKTSANDRKQGEDRLTDLELKQIEGLVRESFAFPPTVQDRFSSPGFLKKDSEVGLFLDMLTRNLGLLKNQFGDVKPRHVDYAFGLLAWRKSKAPFDGDVEEAFDPKAENFRACLQKLTDGEYNKLLAEVDKRSVSDDMKVLLRTTLEVLCNRPEKK